jgi:hypothetical protein
MVAMLCALSALCAAGAAARPGSGPHETVDQRFTTKQPGSPTGVSYTAAYHAAGDPSSPPPFMRRVVVRPPRGMRYDTSVPELCSASDAELQVMGPAACPAGSRLGGGTAEGLLLMPFSDTVFDHFTHNVHLLNNTNEQILLVESEGFTVVRGRIDPDGTMEWTPPTCFPAPPAGGCADDYIIQLKTATTMPAYTTGSGDNIRSYTTTPPRCPARGYWRTRVHFEWSDGSVDDVTSKQHCRNR